MIINYISYLAFSVLLSMFANFQLTIFFSVYITLLCRRNSSHQYHLHSSYEEFKEEGYQTEGYISV